MSSLDEFDTEMVRRAHAIASERSKFTGGIGNRLLIPLLLPAIFMTPRGNFSFLIAFFAVLILEIVLRYGLKMSVKEALFGVWSAAFGRKRKTVKN